MERSLLLIRHNYDMNDLQMSAITLPIGQKDTYPEDIESDDASTTTTTINDSDDNDTDVPSQQSNDTSGMTTQSMSLPRPSGPTIRLPPEGTRSPTSSSLQSSVDSSLNEEKLDEKLITRLRQRVFLGALPESSLAINCGDVKRFGELCDLHGDGSYTFLIQLGSLPKGRQFKMGAHFGTSHSSLNERKLQEKLNAVELSLKAWDDYSGGDCNHFFW